jgi:hypothetical protein
MSVKPVATRALVGAIFFLCAAMEIPNAAVSVSPLFSNHMVLQRNKPVPVYGTAASGENVSVTFSANQGFTITPSNGNSILDVLVDGASVGAVSGYTFNGVTANHTISVKFSQVVSRARWERWS